MPEPPSDVLAAAKRGGPGTAPRLQRELLADGELRLVVDAPLAASVERWVPRVPPSSRAVPPRRDAPAARILLRPPVGEAPSRPAGTPGFGLFGVSAWLDEDAQTVRLHGVDPSSVGRVSLARGRASLRALPTREVRAEAGMDVFTLLTVSAALLLGRMDRALVHAAAVVAPGGGAWLLVGDTHAGKTTTTLNLIRSGFRYLSDDHVVLFADPETGRPWVEGWPRTFHVDEGWARGEVVGRRVDLDPASLGAGRWMRTAPLEGILFPHVSPDAPSRAEPVSDATALIRLVRQSPWFLADRGIAARVLALLERAVRRPAFDVSLGRDCYRDLDRLRTCLSPVFSSRREGP